MMETSVGGTTTQMTHYLVSPTLRATVYSIHTLVYMHICCVKLFKFPNVGATKTYLYKISKVIIQILKYIHYKEGYTWPVNRALY